MARRCPILVGLTLGLAGLAVLLLLVHGVILQALAEWLVVQDQLERADGIVVLAGGTPSREARAATLYQEGWAPRVIISRPTVRRSLQELIDLGIRPLDLQGESRMALEKFGVPADRIIAIPDAAQTTEPELRLVYEAARARDYRRVILVTSPEHTRRVKLVWSKEDGRRIEGIVTPALDADLSLNQWWRQRRAAETVLHEYLGILVISLGISHLFR